MFTHGFMVHSIESMFYYTLVKFLKQWTLYDKNSKDFTETSFYIRNKYNNSFIFHIGQWASFETFLSQNTVRKEFYEIIYEDDIKYDTYEFKLITGPEKQPKDYQEDAKNFIIEQNPESYKAKLICLPTGSGKTFSFLYTCTFLKRKVFVPISPGYMAQWCEVVQQTLNVSKKEIMSINGKDELKGFLDMAVEGTLGPYKFIFVSIDTYRNYIKAYEEKGDSIISEGYACLPHEVGRYAKIGCGLFDEIHENLNLVFKIMSITQCSLWVGLSATFLSKDDFVTKIQKTMFPKELRYDKVKMDKYIGLYSIGYAFNNIRDSKIRTSSWGNNMYSHVEYEKSILKNKRNLQNYMKMVCSVSDMLCRDQLKEGDRYLIFASLKEMCVKIRDTLRQKYTDLKVDTYISGDPDKNIKSDIIVSTLGSAGTALDIPDLRRVFMTTSVDSPVANLQALGRLRNLKEKDTKFAYAWCQEIQKQRQYHFAKQDLFKDRVKYSKNLVYQELL